jgi:hypothetical protein
LAVVAQTQPTMVVILFLVQLQALAAVMAAQKLLDKTAALVVAVGVALLDLTLPELEQQDKVLTVEL